MFFTDTVRDRLNRSDPVRSVTHGVGLGTLLQNVEATLVHSIRGTWYYVDPTDGKATNDGLTRDTAFANILTAYTHCESGAGDGIRLYSRGGSSSATTSYLTAVIDWAKHGITVVGLASPTVLFGRARIANDNATLTLPYLIDVQGDNNVFSNIHIANFGTNVAAVGGLKVSGNRNTFINVHAVGAAGASAAATHRSLELNSAEETTFLGCAFGTDTIERGDNISCEVLFDGITERSRFYGCEFMARVPTGVQHGAIKSNDDNSVFTDQIFEDCTFHVKGTAQTAVLIGTAPAAGWGQFLFKKCSKFKYLGYRGANFTTQVTLDGSPDARADAGTLSYLDAGNVQAIVTVDNTIRKRIKGIIVDCDTLSNNGVLGLQIKVDGTDWREVAKTAFTQASDDSASLFADIVTDLPFRFTWLEGSDEGTDRALPYELSYEYLE